MLDFEKPILDLEKKIHELETHKGIQFHSEITKLKEHKESLIKQIYTSLTPWQIVQIARHAQRPTFEDYHQQIFQDFTELHGDRYFGDDPVIRTGFAYLEKEKVFIIGQQKGKNTDENIKYNFGMPKPEGYRKAHRIMRLAEKFEKPVITFIDTPGAYPGIEAEERGQSKAIADNLLLMSQLQVPIISIVIGEGGSGGALALGVADRLYMLSYSIYSVISPEGCASILWKDVSKAKESAEALRITAQELLHFKIIDGIIEEPLGGAHRHPHTTAQNIKHTLKTTLNALKKLSTKKLLQQRHDKYINIGRLPGGFTE